MIAESSLMDKRESWINKSIIPSMIITIIVHTV